MLVRNKSKLFSEVAEKNHTHSNYRLKNDYGIGIQTSAILAGVGGGMKVEYPNGFNSTNCVPISVLFASNEKPTEWGIFGFCDYYTYRFICTLHPNFMMVRYRTDSDNVTLDKKIEGKLKVVLMKITS